MSILVCVPQAASPTVVVEFGEYELRDGVLDWDASPVTDPNRRGVLTLARDALLSRPVDFAAPCRVLMEMNDGQKEVVFTGLVYAASASEGSWRIEVRTPAQRISEQRAGGMVVGPGTPILDLLWSLMHISGLPDDRIFIEGLALPLPGPFEVAIPVEGVAPDQPLPVANVTFTRDPLISRSVADLLNDKSAALVGKFQDAGAWAFTIVQASTLDEAERIGLEAIDSAMDTVLLAARYSLSVTPDGRPADFLRPANLLATVGRRDVVHVRAMRSAHRWLRGIAWTLHRPEMDAGAFRNLLESAPAGEEADRPLGPAVSAWRRAAETKRPLDQVSALWQALELYAAGTSVEALFSHDELRTLRHQISPALSATQKERVWRSIDQLNNAPLMVRLEHAIQKDGVPLGRGELSVLRRLRTIRNDLEHGKAPTSPQSDDLRRAVAIVARVLVYTGASRAPPRDMP